MTIYADEVVDSIQFTYHSGTSKVVGDSASAGTALAFDAEVPMIVGWDASHVPYKTGEAIACMKIFYIDYAPLM